MLCAACLPIIVYSFLHGCYTILIADMQLTSLNISLSPTLKGTLPDTWSALSQVVTVSLACPVLAMLCSLRSFGKSCVSVVDIPHLRMAAHSVWVLQLETLDISSPGIWFATTALSGTLPGSWSNLTAVSFFWFLVHFVLACKNGGKWF